MIGTGIYLKPSEMAREAGSVELVMLAWVVAGLLALLGALTYTELATAMPAAGGDYVFLSRAFGPVWGFLYGWRAITVSVPASLAAYGAGMMLFARFLWPEVGAPIGTWEVPLPFRESPLRFQLTWAQPLGAAAILLFAAVNFLRVRAVGRLQVVLTTLKVGALAAVAGVALWYATGEPGPASLDGPAAARVAIREPGLNGLLAAVVAALWAYSGWQQVVRVGSEVRDPGRSMPRAMIGGLLFTAGLFLALNLGCFAVLSFDRVAASPHVASELVQVAAGPDAARWLTVAMIITVLGTMNASILTSSRIPFAMARDGLFFPGFSGVHPERRVPTAAVSLTSVMGVVLVLTGTFEDVTALAIFSAWLFYGVGALAVFRLRHLEPDLPRPYRVLGYPVVPALFAILAFALTIFVFVQRPLRSGIGLAIMVLGLPLYYYWRRRQVTRAAL
jgi:amino acid transporter